MAEERKKLHFNENVAMIIIDETSMIPCEFLVLLDERLRVIYDPLMSFREKHIVLCGNFLQMETMFGSALCKGIHLTITEDEIKGQASFF